MTEEFTEENQDTTSAEHNLNDISLRDDLTTKDQHSDQSNSKYNSVSPNEREPNRGRPGRPGGRSSTGRMMLKVIFTPTVQNSTGNSGNQKSAGETDKKTELANTDLAVATTELSAGSDGKNLESLTESTTQDTVNNVNQVTAQTPLKDNTSRVNTAASDKSAVMTQVEDVGNEAERSKAEPDSKKIPAGDELQDDSSISSNDNDDETLEQPMGNTRGKLLVIHSTGEDPMANDDIPITITSSTDGNDIVDGTENQIVGPTKKSSEHKMPTGSDKALETTQSNTEGAETLLGENDRPSSDSGPRKRVDTVSFKVEVTTVVREAALEMEPVEVVVSSCSTSPNSELLEDSEDKVIVNPETDDASYGTLSRRRAKSGIDAVILKSANSARRSVKVNTNVEVVDLTDATGDKNLLPAPHVSTFNRFRNTFSWKRGRSLARQSFADKRQDHFLSFHNISYTVPQKKFFRAIGTKVILKNLRYVIMLLNNYLANILFSNYMHYIFISGIMRTGINAIMGPSGSGKTRYIVTYMYTHIHVCICIMVIFLIVC